MYCIRSMLRWCGEFGISPRYGAPRCTLVTRHHGAAPFPLLVVYRQYHHHDTILGSPLVGEGTQSHIRRYPENVHHQLRYCINLLCIF